jgi:hypothetical protein
MRNNLAQSNYIKQWLTLLLQGYKCLVGVDQEVLVNLQFKKTKSLEKYEKNCFELPYSSYIYGNLI